MADRNNEFSDFKVTSPCDVTLELGQTKIIPICSTHKIFIAIYGLLVKFLTVEMVRKVRETGETHYVRVISL
jgi:hypothetical protein